MFRPALFSLVTFALATTVETGRTTEHMAEFGDSP